AVVPLLAARPVIVGPGDSGAQVRDAKLVQQLDGLVQIRLRFVVEPLAHAELVRCRLMRLSRVALRVIVHEVSPAANIYKGCTILHTTRAVPEAQRRSVKWTSSARKAYPPKVLQLLQQQHAAAPASAAPCPVLRKTAIGAGLRGRPPPQP